MAAPQEGTILKIDNTLTSPNGEYNGAIRVVSANGSSAIPDAPLPTVNGDYTLRVLNGVYTWALEGT